MKTTTHVHTMAQRNAQRQLGEAKANRSRWRLVICTVVLRVGITRVLPLAGSGGWLACLGAMAGALALYWLGCLGLRLTRAATLQETARRLFGAAGTWGVSLLTALLLLWDGCATLTALTTFFTQGIGTRGMQWTMALVSCGALLPCLGGNRLPRGIYLLRGLVGGLLTIALLGLAGMAEADHVFPLLGESEGSLLEGLRAGAGLGWGLLLPLTEEPVANRSRWREPVPPLLVALAVLVLCTLAVPHERWVHSGALAQSMLLPVLDMKPALQLAALCLWMLGLFLLLGAQVTLAAEHAQAPMGAKRPAVAWGMLAALAMTQAAAPAGLWQALGAGEKWLALPLALTVLPVIFGAARGRRST